MTSPEWLAADEDDSDRFPQTAHASALPAPHSPDEGSRVVPDPARVARHSVANLNTADGVTWHWSCTCGAGAWERFQYRKDVGASNAAGEVLARAAFDHHVALAVADEERASLVELVREMGREAVAEAEAYRAVLARAEAAEAEVGRLNLRAGEDPDAPAEQRDCEYQPHFFRDSEGGHTKCLQCGTRLDAPAEQRAEPCPLDAGKRPYWMGVDQYDPCKCLLTKGHRPPCVCKHTERAEGGA